jgi:tetrahydrodipicolinate N-succinyltransferase
MVPAGLAGGAAEVGTGVDVGTGVRVGAGARVAAGPEVACGADVAAGADVACGADVATGADVAAGAEVGRGVAVADAPQAAMKSSSRTAEMKTVALEYLGHWCRIFRTSLGESFGDIRFFPACGNQRES